MDGWIVLSEHVDFVEISLLRMPHVSIRFTEFQWHFPRIASHTVCYKCRSLWSIRLCCCVAQCERTASSADTVKVGRTDTEQYRWFWDVVTSLHSHQLGCSTPWKINSNPQCKHLSLRFAILLILLKIPKINSLIQIDSCVHHKTTKNYFFTNAYVMNFMWEFAFAES